MRLLQSFANPFPRLTLKYSVARRHLENEARQTAGVVLSVVACFSSTPPLLSLMEASSCRLSVTFDLVSGQRPSTSRNLNEMKPRITTIQYMLYAMTEPYVAEFVHPKIALKMPQPPPPLRSGLQH
jgi:hypothetical protein